MIYDEDLTGEECAEEMQKIIDDGSVWSMQGSLGRQAMHFIEMGFCVLGEVGHKNYWGGYVPSRFEVKTGTLGSIEYQQAITN